MCIYNSYFIYCSVNIFKLNVLHSHVRSLCHLVWMGLKKLLPPTDFCNPGLLLWQLNLCWQQNGELLGVFWRFCAAWVLALAHESGALQLCRGQEDWLKLQWLFGGLFSGQGTSLALSSFQWMQGTFILDLWLVWLKQNHLAVPEQCGEHSHGLGLCQSCMCMGSSWLCTLGADGWVLHGDSCFPSRVLDGMWLNSNLCCRLG